MNNPDCSFVGVWAGVWHDGVMFNNESVLKSIGRRVFPDMGPFSEYGRARVGLWNAHLCVGDEAAWLTVSIGRDFLFQIEARGSQIEATYALPVVVAGEYGTAWSNSRRWHVDGWPDIMEVSTEIREFFDNEDEYLEREAEVYKVLEGAE